jgi:hypothetical protein
MIGAVLRATSVAGADGPERRLTTSTTPATTIASSADPSQRTGTDADEVDRARRVAISRVRPGRSTSPRPAAAVGRTGGAASQTPAFLRAATGSSGAVARHATGAGGGATTAGCRSWRATRAPWTPADDPFEAGAGRAVGRATDRIATVCRLMRRAAACGCTRARATVTPEAATAGSVSAVTGAGAAGWAGSEAGSAAGVVSTGASGVAACCAATGGDGAGAGAACGFGAGLAGAAGCRVAGFSGRGGRKESGSR